MKPDRQFLVMFVILGVSGAFALVGLGLAILPFVLRGLAL